jgi:hypothetical protein
VRRLNAIIEGTHSEMFVCVRATLELYGDVGNDAPVISSTRAETQALIKELRDGQDRLKQELKVEREKNDKLVSKALELEREKNALVAANTMYESSKGSYYGTFYRQLS